MSAKLNLPQSNFYGKSTAAKLKRDRKLVPLTHPSKKQIEEFVLAVLPLPPVDFTVQNEGSIFLLHPHTEAAIAWVDEHIPEDAQYFCKAVVVEHRYIADIVHGIQDDGLVVR